MSRRFLAVPVALALLTLASSASAALYVHRITATEAEECPAPPSPSGATGSGEVIINTATNTISYDIRYENISGTFSAAHFHGFSGVCPATAGVRITLTSNGAGRLTGSSAYPEGDEPSYLGGLSYFNLHTSLNGAGQIRDQLVPVQVGALPLANPGSIVALAMALVSAGGVWMARRRRIA